MKKHLIIISLGCVVLTIAVGAYHVIFWERKPLGVIVETTSTAADSALLGRWDALRDKLKGSKESAATPSQIDSTIGEIIELIAATADLLEASQPKTDEILSLAERNKETLALLPVEKYLTADVNVLAFLCEEQVLLLHTSMRSADISKAQSARLIGLVTKDPVIDAELLQRMLEQESGGSVKVSAGDVYDVVLEAMTHMDLVILNSSSRVRDVVSRFSVPYAAISDEGERKRAKTIGVLRAATSVLLFESVEHLLLEMWKAYGTLPATGAPPNLGELVDKLDPVFKKMIADGGTTETAVRSNALAMLRPLASDAKQRQSIVMQQLGQLKQWKATTDVMKKSLEEDVLHNK